MSSRDGISASVSNGSSASDSASDVSACVDFACDSSGCDCSGCDCSGWDVLGWDVLGWDETVGTAGDSESFCVSVDVCLCRSASAAASRGVWLAVVWLAAGGSDSRVLVTVVERCCAFRCDHRLRSPSEVSARSVSSFIGRNHCDNSSASHQTSNKITYQPRYLTSQRALVCMPHCTPLPLPAQAQAQAQAHGSNDQTQCLSEEV